MTTTAEPVTAALATRWRAEFNPRAGAWSVITERITPTPVDFANQVVVADAIDQTTAEHIAELHNATLTLTDRIRPIVEAHIGAHLATQARTETRYGVEDAAGNVYEAFGPADAQSMLDDVNCGPQPRRLVTWHVTTSPPLAYQPASAETGATA